MPALTAAAVEELADKIRSFDKESLPDMLYHVAEAVQQISHHSRCRIYLEDLTNGRLEPALISGLSSRLLEERSYPLYASQHPVSLAYSSQEELNFPDLHLHPLEEVRQEARQFDLRASWQLPLVHGERPVGVLCVDSLQPGQLPDAQQRRTLRQDHARNLPQLARRLHAGDPHSRDPEKQRAFFRFKNFFYKTLKARLEDS